MRVIYVIFSVNVNGVYINNFGIEIDEEHLEGLKKILCNIICGTQTLFILSDNLIFDFVIIIISKLIKLN